MHNTQWIRVAAINVTSQQITIHLDDYVGRQFSSTLDYSCNISEALAVYDQRAIQKLLNYLGISQAFYFFNFEYYDEVIALYELDSAECAYFENLSLHGFAEFKFTNNIPVAKQVHFRGDKPLGTASAAAAPALHGAVVTNGGGKDGVVAMETASSVWWDDLSWFTLNERGLRSQIIEASPIHQKIYANRKLTPSIEDQKYSGHRPFSAEVGIHATIAALAMGKRYAITANEFSANEPNMVVDGFAINHQYTKSFEFELQLAKLIDGLDLGVSYFSIVRPLYELQILKFFTDFPAYHSIFVSCNHGVIHGKWCMACAKCAFVVLGVTAINPAITEKIWGDRLAVALPALQEHIISLVDDQPKPFECVGTLDECRLALAMLRASGMFDELPVEFQAKLAPFMPSEEQYQALRTAILLTFADRPNNIPDALRAQVFDFYTSHLQ